MQRGDALNWPALRLPRGEVGSVDHVPLPERAELRTFRHVQSSHSKRILGVS